ncbi:MAG: helix-hairpin-helix domain-containing protein [Caldisericia bacterium]
MLSGSIQPNESEKSFEKATSASASLGWIKLDEYINTTESYLRISELEPLKLELAKGFRNKFNAADFKSTNETKTSALKNINPAIIETPVKSEIIPNLSSKQYKDGFGDISIFDATFDQIDKIPYVSIQAADAVFKHVQKNKITNFDELLSLKGVGPKTVERLRENFHIK